MESIKNLREEFRRAYYWVSFDPEKRADRSVLDFTKMLADDLSELGDKAGNYEEKFIENLKKWIAAQSRCASSVITGGSGFDAAKANRNNNRVHAAWENFQTWRAKIIGSVKRIPTPSPEAEIDIVAANLEKDILWIATMHAANKIASEKITDAEKEKKFDALFAGNKELVTYAMKEVAARCWVYQPYTFTNANARRRGKEKRLNILKARIQNKDNFQEIKFAGGTISIESDRVVIKHDAKPDKEIIENLKKHGFRWSPKCKNWCRKHTRQAILDAKEICGVK